MTEKIGPKEAQVKALREARVQRARRKAAGLVALREAVDEVLKAPPKAKKRSKRCARGMKH